MSTKIKPKAVSVKGSLADQLEVVKNKITAEKDKPKAAEVKAIEKEEPKATAKVSPVKKAKSLNELIATEVAEGSLGASVGNSIKFAESFGISEDEAKDLVKRVVTLQKKYAKEFFFDAEGRVKMTYDGWMIASLCVLETADPQKVIAHRVKLFEVFKQMQEVCNAVAADAESEQLQQAA